MSRLRSQMKTRKRFLVQSAPNADARARSFKIEARRQWGYVIRLSRLSAGYPYGCTEQTMSSFLPNVIVTQALKDVKSSSIRNTNELPKKVQKGLDRLYAYQHDDGGWGWWKDDQSDPFMTAYVVNGLTLAKQSGYQPDDARIASGREKLKQMLDSGTTEAGTGNRSRNPCVHGLALQESGNSTSHLESLWDRGNLQPVAERFWRYWKQR